MCAKMAFQHQAGTAMECLSIPITLQKEPGLDPEGREVLKCGFKIGGGIDQDYRKSPQGYTDNCIQKSDTETEMDDENTDMKIQISDETGIDEDEDGCDEIQEIVVFIEEYNQENNILLKEEAQVDRYIENDCCKLMCNQRITRDEFLKYRRESQELDYNEQGVNQLDTVMLGVLRVISRGSGEYKAGRIIRKIDRKRLRPNFLLGGLQVCKATFLFAHALTSKRFKRLLKNFKEGGLYLKTHGNYGRLSSRKISVEAVQKAVNFIRQFAEGQTKSTASPGKKKRRNVRILPHTVTKTNVYKMYKEKCDEENIITPISTRTFLRIWNQCCPDIVIQKAPIKPERCQRCHPAVSQEPDAEN